jgi:DNA-binding transcriptional LysR family regulator
MLNRPDAAPASLCAMPTIAIAEIGVITMAWPSARITFCPPYIVADLLASKALVPLLPHYKTLEIEVVALYPHRRQLSAKVRLFLDMLVGLFAEEQQHIDGTGPA